MKTEQDYTYPEKEQSLVDFKDDHTAEISSLPEDKLFAELLAESGLKVNEKGIYQAHKTGITNISNFSNIKYLFNKIQGNQKFRFIKINDTIFKITPEDLVNRNNFRKLLLSSNYDLSCSNRLFNKLVNIIIKLDNGKIINDTTGYGKVSDHIYNFGNKILVNNELSDFKPTVWLGKKGYLLNKTDMLQVTDEPFNPSELWNTFFKLYGMQAVLIIGFAVATLFFQEYMKKEKKFPLLYIKAGSGRGKTGLTELIENLFGIKHPFANINCSSNSTKIGIESKSILLNNLPLILNELTDKEFQFIKSRYDGQGSVKYSDFKPGNISERSVNGSTVITTVVEPKDKQVISRCVFINLDIIEMNETAFEQARTHSKKFASFTCTVLKNISFCDIITQIKQFKERIHCSEVQPRINDNYSIIAGCFQAFASMMPKNEKLPDVDEIRDFLIGEMKTTENYLNPLSYFLRELERLAECKISHRYITQDEKFIYFNFNGVWSLISQTYKDRYLPFITSSNIKNLIKKSQYIAHYGRDFDANAKNPAGKPIYTYFKRIEQVSRRCIVLINDELPGYYR
jgi:hypothetical protein